MNADNHGFKKAPYLRSSAFIRGCMRFFPSLQV
jgi:hypothetical protein